MIVTDQDWILDFLSGKQGDYKGRTFNDMLAFSDHQLEACHDQIQWMFPLHEESKRAHTYPILTPEIVARARESKEIQNNMRMAFDRISNFFGLDNKDREKQMDWCRDWNHNLLRVTRIIRSLRILGLDHEAALFFETAMEAGDHFGVSLKTQAFWWQAFHEDLWKTLR